MKNALLGYTYQHYVASLLLAKMDVERSIEKIVLEADVDHKFDDITLETGPGRYYLQIKDFENIALDALSVSNDSILINGKAHRLSKETNVIFFKKINFTPSCKIFGFPAQQILGVYIVSLSRDEIDRTINKLYQKDLHRKSIIERFLAERLDQRSLEFTKRQLPAITVFNTRLIERTVKVSRTILKFENILLIEGKPGIGKSHLVGLLEKQFKHNMIYRFWVSNQDDDYDERLKYGNFIRDLSKKLFQDYKEHSEQEIISALETPEMTLIIDGLDHVENYNKSDLENFTRFIDSVQQSCKTIVLSRPLQIQTSWKKQVLGNWNDKQTRKVLKDLYQIEDYDTWNKIYGITDGYPILVRYVAQHYKKEGNLPETEKFDSINSYYDHLLKDEKSKQALALFLCCRGFLMRSEISGFLDDYPACIVEEFVDQRPYLFELRLNRISLFHDSLITYLRKSGINYGQLKDRVNDTVFQSLLRGEYRFQSRIGHFDLSLPQVKAVMQWYASISNFRRIMRRVIDFEAVREFYLQIRNMLSLLSAEDLDLTAYYDLTLILNLVQRDHVSTIHGFNYTYIQSLLANGYTQEDITSSKYLFAMWYYIQTNDASLLLDATSNDNYDTNRFYLELDNALHKEQTFFEFQRGPFAVAKIRKVLLDIKDLEYRKYLGYVLVNLYLHEANRSKFPDYYQAVKLYMQGDENAGIGCLIRTVADKRMEYYQASYVLEIVKQDLLAYGVDPEKNDYLTLSLKGYLNKHGEKGSFTLWPEVLSYLRLSLHHGKQIDLASISKFWTKYHQRHDYSLHSLDYALTVFEQKKWTGWEASVTLITEVQVVSEKGYRGLLAEYIMEHEPEFLLSVLAKFPAEDLKIPWFDLEPSYLDVLLDEVYQNELYKIFRYDHDGKISLDKIKNLLRSNKVHLLKKDLKRYRYCITVKSGDGEIDLLKQYQIPYLEIDPGKSYESDKTSQKRYEQGVIDRKNMDVIKKNKLSPAEVASLADEYYTVLASPELFREFPKSRVKRDIKLICFNALTGRSKRGESHHVVWAMPGTMLKIMFDNDIVIPKAIFRSFLSFLEISMVKLNKDED